MKTSKILVLPMLLVAGAATAQDFTQAPLYGEVALESGFVPDPHVTALQAGGSNRLNGDLGPGCVGVVANAPDLNFRYQAGDVFPLNIYAVSDTDTTLVINQPDGSWICNDDSEGLNPLVHLANPASGLYNIWVGTYDGEISPAELKISEITPDWSASNAPAGGQAAGGVEAHYGEVVINTGFADDPHRIEMLSGGSLNASEVAGAGCVGFISNRPDVNLTYTAGDVFPLNLYVSSDADTTLVVNLPDGTWACNDDAEGLNPALSFESPQSGLYNIWVGTYGETRNQASVLNISELSPQW